MIADILNSLIWKLRSDLRLEGVPLFSGHGFADANYRPNRLPYASVVGPLNFELEPDRDPPRSAFIYALRPGYIASPDGINTRQVPGPGQLHLTIDGNAEVSLALDFGADAGQNFDNDIGPRVASVGTTALANAVDAGQVTVGSLPVNDPDARAVLRGSRMRWDRQRQRLVFVSGRRQVTDQHDRLSTIGASSVEVRTGPADLADALGFRDDATLIVPGRIGRHRISQPTAVAVDVRLDLWAESQQHLADLLERWATLTPTRSRLLVCPSVLRDDVSRSSERVRVLPGLWPVTPWTLALMDGAADFDNRANDDSAMLTAPAAIVANALRVSGTGTASVRVWEPPPLPRDFRPDHPAPHGYGLTLDLSTVGAPADGETMRIATLTSGATEALSVTVVLRTRAGTLEAVVQVRAAREGGGFAPRDFLIEPGRLQSGVLLHVVVEAATGRVMLFADGEPLPLDDSAPEPPIVAGRPIGDDDMRLVFGAATGIGRAVNIRRAELLGRPIGPMDPLFSGVSTGAQRWRVGDPVALKRHDEDETREPFSAIVTAIEGDTLVLDRPIPRDFPRASSLVFKRALFFAQKQWRRRDDLMNRLFRLTAEYRVSAYLEERLPSQSAPIVEVPDVDVRDAALLLAEQRAFDRQEDPPPPPLAPPSGTPGVRAVIVEAPADPRRSAGAGP